MSEIITIDVIVGRKLIPIEIERVGRKLAVSAPNKKPITDELRCMKGAQFDWDEKRWHVSDVRRNWMQFELMQGKTPPEFSRYDLPVVPVEPHRSCAMAHQRSMLSSAMTVRRINLAAEQGVGKTLVYIEIMEHAAALGFTDWWFVAPLKVIRAIQLELRKWKCTVQPKLVNYDILARELESKFRCPQCREVSREGQIIVKPDAGHCPACRAFKRHSSLFDEAFGPWPEGAEPLYVCRKCDEGIPASQTRPTFSTRCPCSFTGQLEKLPDPPAPHGVIFDESSFLKSSDAVRTDAAEHLAEAIRAEHDGFVIEGSGTPAPKDPTDWHAQAEILCPGFLRESTRNHLLKRLAVSEKRCSGCGDNSGGCGCGVQAFPKIVSWRMDEVALLHKRLRGLVEIHLAKDCIELPELRHECVILEPSPEIRRAARLVAQTSVNAAGALNRLRQLSDGFQYGASKACECGGGNFECPTCEGAGFTFEAAVRAECPKDDALADILGRNEETGRIVVYAGFRESIDRASDVCLGQRWNVLRCDGRGWALDGQSVSDAAVVEILAEMDAGTRSDRFARLAVVAHPGSGGYGLNLTAATSNVLFSLDFNAANYWQAIKRSHRNGQTRGVTIWRLVHLPTDELVFKNLEAKRVLQAVTLGEVAEVLA